MISHIMCMAVCRIMVPGMVPPKCLGALPIMNGSSRIMVTDSIRIVIQPIQTSSMPQVREETQFGSIRKPVFQKISSPNHRLAIQNSDSIGMHHLYKVLPKRIVFMLEHSFCLCLMIGVIPGRKFLPTSPPMIQKDKDKTVPVVFQ